MKHEPTKEQIERVARMQLACVHLSIDVLFEIPRLDEYGDEISIDYTLDDAGRAALERYFSDEDPVDQFEEIGEFTTEIVDPHNCARFAEDDPVMAEGSVVDLRLDEWLEAKRRAQWNNGGRCRYTVDMFGGETDDETLDDPRGFDADFAIEELARSHEYKTGVAWVAWVDYGGGEGKQGICYSVQYRGAAESLERFMRHTEALPHWSFGVESHPMGEELFDLYGSAFENTYLARRAYFAAVADEEE